MPLGLSGSGEITGFDPTASGFGKVLQVVRATDTTDRTTTSTSFVDVTGMSVTITPQKNTSSIILIASFSGRSDGGSTVNGSFQITDSSNNAISGANGYRLVATGSILVAPVTIIAYATPATTSATIYKLRFRTASSNVQVENAVNTGQMYAIEVAA